MCSVILYLLSSDLKFIISSCCWEKWAPSVAPSVGEMGCESKSLSVDGLKAIPPWPYDPKVSWTLPSERTSPGSIRVFFFGDDGISMMLYKKYHLSNSCDSG